MAKVLVIDDDRAMTTALRVRLTNAGLEVVTVNNPSEGSACAVRERPDVIILDVDMPHFSGLDLHECLRFAERSRHIPVVYLSAQDSETVRQSAFEQGARAFLTKPFDSQHLIETIHEVIASGSADHAVG